jgi:hypothetical protein
MIMKIKFEIEIEYGEDEEKQFGSVEAFIEEMIDQYSSDFNDVDMWETEED